MSTHEPSQSLGEAISINPNFDQNPIFVRILETKRIYVQRWNF
jgi:hypothetical protein